MKQLALFKIYKKGCEFIRTKIPEAKLYALKNWGITANLANVKI